jgi:hypothetical protein
LLITVIDLKRIINVRIKIVVSEPHNHAAQLGCQVVNGAASISWPPMWAPVVEWIVLDMTTAIAIALCPQATRTHALLAITLGFQVLISASFAARGVPDHALDLYLAIIGFAGWCQLFILSGGANHGRLAGVAGAWRARRRLHGAGALNRSRMEPEQ